MKSSTVIGLAILAALGVGAYYIYTKNKAVTTGTAAAGAATTAITGGLSSFFSGLVSDIGGVFSGSGAAQTVQAPTSSAGAAAGTDYTDLTDPSLSVLSNF